MDTGGPGVKGWRWTISAAGSVSRGCAALSRPVARPALTTATKTRTAWRMGSA